MSWIEKLYETYESCASAALDVSEGQAALLPICHTTQNAQIEAVLDGEGNFLRARVLDKRTESKTVIPCTEESGGRTSGHCPHPLHDNLMYLDPAFSEYGGAVPKYLTKTPTLPYEDYVAQLSSWCASPYSHPTAEAVLRYVQKAELIKLLVEHRILYLDDKGKLMTKWDGDKKDAPPIFSYSQQELQKCFVRFRVETPNTATAPPWEDVSLMRSWEQYYMSTKTDLALCYVTGAVVPRSIQHPAKLRNSGDRSKLISTNDSSGLTYRGRFTHESQVMQVGYEVSQKAHSALRWLIEKQGYRNDSQAIVAWSVQDSDLPPLLADTHDLQDHAVRRRRAGAQALVADTDDDLDDLPSDTETAFTDEFLADRLKKAIAGYRQELDVHDRVVVMGIDSTISNQGRMSITFYRELLRSPFLDRLENWHRTCSWKHSWKSRDETDAKGKTKARYFTFVGAPAPRDIAYAAYGDDKLKKATVERLLPCIIDAQPLPADIVQSVVNRAKMRVAFETEWEWGKTLSIACALYRKLNERKGYQMALEETRTTRDYLYGRLLAVADIMEDRALYQAGESRSTNAARMMNRFADHPYTTWRTLDGALSPYRMRLGKKANWYLKLIQDIMVLFETDDFTNDSPLSGEYLLGYYCQRDALIKKKSPEETAGQDE